MSESFSDQWRYNLHAEDDRLFYARVNKALEFYNEHHDRQADIRPEEIAVLNIVLEKDRPTEPTALLSLPTSGENTRSEINRYLSAYEWTCASVKTRVLLDNENEGDYLEKVNYVFTQYVLPRLQGGDPGTAELTARKGSLLETVEEAIGSMSSDADPVDVLVRAIRQKNGIIVPQSDLEHELREAVQKAIGTAARKDELSNEITENVAKAAELLLRSENDLDGLVDGAIDQAIEQDKEYIQGLSAQPRWSKWGGKIVPKTLVVSGPTSSGKSSTARGRKKDLVKTILGADADENDLCLWSRDQTRLFVGDLNPRDHKRNNVRSKSISAKVMKKLNDLGDSGEYPVVSAQVAELPDPDYDGIGIWSIATKNNGILEIFEYMLTPEEAFRRAQERADAYIRRMETMPPEEIIKDGLDISRRFSLDEIRDIYSRCKDNTITLLSKIGEDKSRNVRITISDAEVDNGNEPNLIAMVRLTPGGITNASGIYIANYRRLGYYLGENEAQDIIQSLAGYSGHDTRIGDPDIPIQTYLGSVVSGFRTICTLARNDPIYCNIESRYFELLVQDEQFYQMIETLNPQAPLLQAASIAKNQQHTLNALSSVLEEKTVSEVTLVNPNSGRVLAVFHPAENSVDVKSAFGLYELLDRNLPERDRPAVFSYLAYHTDILLKWDYDVKSAVGLYKLLDQNLPDQDRSAVFSYLAYNTDILMNTLLEWELGSIELRNALQAAALENIPGFMESHPGKQIKILGGKRGEEWIHNRLAAIISGEHVEIKDAELLMQLLPEKCPATLLYIAEHSDLMFQPEAELPAGYSGLRHMLQEQAGRSPADFITRHEKEWETVQMRDSSHSGQIIGTMRLPAHSAHQSRPEVTYYLATIKEFPEEAEKIATEMEAILAAGATIRLAAYSAEQKNDLNTDRPSIVIRPDHTAIIDADSKAWTELMQDKRFEDTVRQFAEAVHLSARDYVQGTNTPTQRKKDISGGLGAGG